MTSNKTFQRLLSVLLFACMLLSLMPGFALAEAEIETAEEAIVEEAASVVEETAEALEEMAEAAEEDTLVVEAVEIEAAEEEEISAIEPVTEGLESAVLGGEVAEPQVTIEQGTHYIQYYANDGYDSRFSRKEHNTGDVVNLNEASFTDSRLTENYEGTYAEKNVLVGWNTSKEGTGTAYALTDTLIMPEDNLTLYGVWEKQEADYWALTVVGHGRVEYKPLLTTPHSSEDLCVLRDDGVAKLYVAPNTLKIRVGTIHGFTPIPDDGYVFDGWYFYSLDDDGEKQEVTNLTAKELKDLVLGKSIREAGRNKIIARFIEPDETCAKLTFTGTDNGIAEKFMYLEKGSDMPEIETPVWKNHFFLGWEPELPAVVPEEDTTYAAKWLEGPTSENTVEPMFYLRCVSEDGIGDETHDPQPYSWFFCKSNDDISFDGTNYVCTATLDNPSIISTGRGCYDILSGQEHFLVDKDAVINLFWNGEKWAPADGAQYFDVYHYTEVPAETVALVTPVIYVVDSENTETYKALSLLEDTYEITYYDSLGGISTAASGSSAVLTITDFDAYAKQLGANYVPVDLEAEEKQNLYSAEEYAFYFSRTQGTCSVANGSTYATWSIWSYDGQSEFKDGSVLDQSVYGKELLVKLPTCKLVFTDEYGILPTQTFEVKAGDPYPQYNYTAEGVDPDIAEAVLNGKPVQIDGAWYIFGGWDGYPLSLFGSVPTVSEDKTFTAIWEPVEVRTVTFTDGSQNGKVFSPVQYRVRAGDPLPFTLSENDSSRPNLYALLYDLNPGLIEDEFIAPDGRVFVGWDPDPVEYAENDAPVSDDIVFEAFWDWYVEAFFLNENNEQVRLGDGLLLIDGIPEPEEEPPEREGYTFVGWGTVADEKADGSFYEENTGYTVSYRDITETEEGETYTYRYFYVLFRALWVKDDAAAVEAYGCSLSLEGDIAINIYLIVPEEVLADTDAYVTLNGNVLLISAAKTKTLSDGTTLREFKYRVAAKEMNKAVVLHAYDGENNLLPLILQEEDITEWGYWYSVQRYVELAQEKGTEKVKTLTKAMSDYGSKAQMYLGYEVETAVEIYNAEAIANVTVEDLAPYARVITAEDGSGITYYGSNLTLEAKTTSRLFFVLEDGQNIEDFRFTIDGVDTAAVKSGSYYAVEVKNIAAKELDTMHTIEVYRTGEETPCIQIENYGLSYAYQVLNGESTKEKLIELVKALYLYNQAANAYFGA